MSGAKLEMPLPHPTPLSKPHWDGCKEGKLRVQKCADCDTYIFIPAPCCSNCLGESLEWVDSSGLGVLYSYTIVHRPQQPSFEVPYIVAVVELEEGWYMLSNLRDISPEEVEIGMPLEVVFEKRSPEITLPLFRRRDE